VTGDVRRAGYDVSISLKGLGIRKTGAAAIEGAAPFFSLRRGAFKVENPGTLSGI
jgi:hypothetical protein